MATRVRGAVPTLACHVAKGVEELGRMTLEGETTIRVSAAKTETKNFLRIARHFTRPLFTIPRSWMMGGCGKGGEEERTFSEREALKSSPSR